MLKTICKSLLFSSLLLLGGIARAQISWVRTSPWAVQGSSVSVTDKAVVLEDDSKLVVESGTTTLAGVEYYWPDADGSTDQVLTTDGSGTLSWEDQSGGSGDDLGNHVATTTIVAGYGIDATTITLGSQDVLLDYDGTNYELDVSSNLSVEGKLTLTSATTAQSTFDNGLVVNDTGGGAAIDDFRVETDNAASAFVVDASADAVLIDNSVSLRIPSGTSPTVDAQGEIAVDTNGLAASQGTIIGYDGTQVFYVVTTTDTPSDNYIPKYDASGGRVRWEPDAGGSGEGDAVLDSTQTWTGGNTWESWTVYNGSVTLNNVSTFTITDARFVVTGNTVSINGVTYYWPSSDGSNGNVLHTNGSGTLSWDTDDTGGGSGGSVEVQDDGAEISPAVSTFNFTTALISTLSASGNASIYVGVASPLQVVSSSITVDASSVTLLGPTIEESEISDFGTYLTESSATATYLQLSSATATYLQNSSATLTYQPLDDDLTDLADGSLTGSKVGDGVPAANIAAGSLPSDVIASSVAIDTIGLSQMADEDHGDIAWSGGSATVENVAAANVAAGNLGASVIASSVAVDAVGIAQLSASGSPSGSTFLRGDNTWDTPAGSGDAVLAATQTWTGGNTYESWSIFNGSATFNSVSSFTITDAAFVVTGNTVSINGVTYYFPSSDGASDGYVLTTDSAGTLTWEQDDTSEASGTTIEIEDGGVSTVNTSTIDFTGAEFIITDNGGDALVKLDPSSVTLLGASIPATKIDAGTLGATVIVSSVGANTITSQQMANDDHGDISWSGNVATVDNVAAANVAAGSLGASVITSSVAVNTVGVLQMTHEDHGDVTWGTGNAVVENVVCTTCIDISAETNLAVESDSLVLNGDTIEIDESSVTLQGNDFNSANQLVKLDSNSYVPNSNIDPSSVTKLGPSIDISDETNLAVEAGVLTLNGDTVEVNESSATLLGPKIDLSGSEVEGILADARMPDLTGNVTTVEGNVATTIVSVPNAALDESSVTLQGNDFNAANQLARLDSNAYIPNSNIDPSSVTKLGQKIDLSGSEVEGILADARMPNLTGDVTTTEGTVATTIADNAVDGTDISLASEAQGDVMYFNGTDWIRLPIGSPGEVLEVADGGTSIEWDTDNQGTGGATIDVQDGGAGTVNTSTIDFTGAEFIITNNGGEALVKLDPSSVTLLGASIPAAKIDAGSLGASVIASSIAINAVGVSQMADVDHGDVSWVSGNAVVDNVAAANVAAGTLGATVIVSSVGANTITSQQMGNDDHGDVSWTGNVATVDNVAAANIAAGSLGASVIASSVAIDSIGISQLSASGSPSDSTYLRGDNSWASVPTGGGSVEIQDNGDEISPAVSTINFTTALISTLSASGNASVYVGVASPLQVINSSITVDASSVTLLGPKIEATEIEDGYLGANVIASSIAVHSVGLAQMAAEDHGDVNWTSGNAVVDNVAAANIAGGTMDADVIVSSVGANTVTSQQMGNDDHGDISWTNNVATVDNVAAANVASGSLGASVITSSIAINSVGVLQMTHEDHGDVTWASGNAVVDNVAAANVAAGTLGATVIVSSVGANTVTSQQMGNDDHGDVSWSGNVATVDNVAAANVAAGTLGASVIASSVAVDVVGLAQLSASGSPSGSNFLRGDNTWATPGGSGDAVLAATQTWTGGNTFDSWTIFDGSATFNNVSSFTLTSAALVVTQSTFSMNGVVYYWPSSDGASDGYVLTTDSAGTLTWEADDTGGGGGSIEVQDDGVEISPQVSTINFTTALISTLSASGNVSVYVGVKSPLQVDGSSITVDASSVTLLGPKIEATEVEDGYLGSGVIASSIAVHSVGLAQMVAEDHGDVNWTSGNAVVDNVAAANVAAGTLGATVIVSSVGANTVTSQQMGNDDHGDVSWSGNVATVDNVAAANVAAGSLGSSVIASSIAIDAVGIAQLSASGSPSGSNYLRGDNTWGTPGGSGDAVLAATQTWTGGNTFDSWTVFNGTITAPNAFNVLGSTFQLDANLDLNDKKIYDSASNLYASYGISTRTLNLGEMTPQQTYSVNLNMLNEFTNVKAENNAVTGGVGISGCVFVPEVELLFLVDNNSVNVSIYKAYDIEGTEFGNITFSGFADTEGLEWLWTIYNSSGQPEKGVFAVCEEGLTDITLFEWTYADTSGTITKSAWPTLTPTNMWTDDSSFGLESITYNPFKNELYAAKQSTPLEFRIIPLDGNLSPAAIEPFDAAAKWTTVPAINGMTFDRNTRTVIAIGDENGASNDNQDIWSFDPYDGTIIEEWDSYINDCGLTTGAGWGQSEGIAITPDGQNLFVTSESNEVAWLTRDATIDTTGIMYLGSTQTITGEKTHESSATFQGGITIENLGDLAVDGAGVNFGGATYLELPNGASPTVDGVGEIAVDTTDSQLIWYDGANAVVVPSTFSKSMTIESPTAGDFPFFWRTHENITVTSIHCISSAATSTQITVEECDSAGANCTAVEAAITCTTSDTSVNGGDIDNSAIDAGDRIRVLVGTVSGTPGWAAVDVYYRETRD